jgi:hypothetical protein
MIKSRKETQDGIQNDHDSHIRRRHKQTQPKKCWSYYREKITTNKFEDCAELAFDINHVTS